MKSITIAGNIGKDAEVRSTQGGDKVTGWTVAVEDRTGKEKSTIWFDCTLWGKRGESLAQYLTKGSKVCVSGELSKREHDGKTYLTVRAEQVTLIGGKPDAQRDNDRGHDPTGHHDRRGAAPAGGNPMDDEIPF
jgi:single-strand DNA-binding protein